MTARSNLRRICDTHLAGRYDLNVVDLAENLRLVAEERVLATLKLVRCHPEPARRIMRGLSNTAKLLHRLDIRTGQDSHGRR